jgi:Flp pilus assembly protein TadG
MTRQLDRLHPHRGWKRQRGTILLFLVISLVALIGVAALATDVGHVWAVRTELQRTVDASALAAAANLVDPTNTTVTLDQARDNAETYGAQNPADGVAISIDRNADVTFGDWDLDAGTFDTTVDLTVPEEVTAVRVDGRMDGTQNRTVATVLARVLGRTEFPVGANAIGNLGWAGSFAPGSADLPIAIDCCAITGDPSCTGFCEYIQQNPYPNPTTLSDGVTPATRLEFNSTPEQNSCWTDFEQDTNISTPVLEGVVDDGNTTSFGIQDPGIQLDNGDKTPIVRMIRDKFQGIGDYAGYPPEGQDLYDPPAGTDSWTVWFPLVECQAEDHCAGNNVVPVIGAVCFEIREVNVTPEKEILGQFFCPMQRPELDCGPAGGSGSGGQNFGIRATRPVLVQ